MRPDERVLVVTFRLVTAMCSKPPVAEGAVRRLGFRKPKISVINLSDEAECAVAP